MEIRKNEELNEQLLEILDQQLGLLQEQKQMLLHRKDQIHTQMESDGISLTTQESIGGDLLRVFLEEALIVFGKRKQAEALQAEYLEKKQENERDVSLFRQRIEGFKERLREEI